MDMQLLRCVQPIGCCCISRHHVTVNIYLLSHSEETFHSTNKKCFQHKRLKYPYEI